MKYPKSRGNAATFFAALAVFVGTVCLFIGVFWWYGEDEFRVSPGKEYYFLVRDCESATAAAVAGQVYLAGGAGYLLETGEGVILSCYFRLQDAERVQSAMSEKKVETRILTLSSADFELRGEAAAFGRAVLSDCETAETCARILYDTANGLERADLSQEEARAAVRGVSKSLKGLRLANTAELFALWNARLAEAERRAAELAEGILFAKDLRYLQVSLCLDILRADEYFG